MEGDNGEIKKILDMLIGEDNLSQEDLDKEQKKLDVLLINNNEEVMGYIDNRILKNEHKLDEVLKELENLQTQTPESIECDSLLTCNDCSTQPQCGWCKSTGKCVGGDATGIF